MKKIWSITKTPVVLIVLGFCLCSCQALVFAWFGIKNPEKAVSKKERLAYYEPFMNNHQVTVRLYALSDTTKWSKTMEKFYGYTFPMIYLSATETDSLYSLSCFEDIKWQVNLINKNNLEYTDLGDEEKITYVKTIITNSAELLYESKKTAFYRPAEWHVLVVSATFLGKKLRKRMLPIFDLKGLGSITILDLSKIKN